MSKKSAYQKSGTGKVAPFRGNDRNPGTWSEKVDPKYLQRLKGFVPKNTAQHEILRSLEENPITIIVGPAGTGKTITPISWSVDALVEGLIEKVVAVRPPVEVGNSVGYLTGDLYSKMAPYLRPVVDGYVEFIGSEQLKALVGDEFAPIVEFTSPTYMRGRTVKDAFYLVDEAQNCTLEEFRMLLTRVGEGCHMAVTLDPQQCDLKGEAKLQSAMNYIHLLENQPGIKVIYLDATHVVRHKVVKTVIKALEAA